jgi:hypothetical protein
MEAKKLVEDVVERFGPRRAGSQAERKTQEYLTKIWGEFCDFVKIHEFRAPLRAKFGLLKPVFLLYGLSLVGVWIFPAAAVFFSTAAALSFVVAFVMNYPALDVFYKHHDSCNAIADLPSERPAKMTLILSGHADSTPEFRWWYRWKQFGLRAMVISGASLTFYPFFCVAALIWAGPLAHHPPAWMGYAWLIFIAAAPLSVTYWDIHHDKIVSPGAQDNLSGVAVATAVGRALAAGPRLKHVAVRIVAFGAEETGLRGSAAYVKDHLQRLKQENVLLLNFDGILDAENLHILTGEPFSFVKYDTQRIAELEACFRAVGAPVKKGPLPIGGTDAVSFRKAGLQALTVVGLPLDRLHPTYHTRLDLPEYVQEQALEYCIAAAVRYARLLDEKLD